MTDYEVTYPGADYLLDANYGFTGYRIPAGSIGASTGIQTANQLGDVNNYLNQGMNVVELSTIDPGVLEMIPKEHFKEIERLNKLTGASTTIHSPQLDPAGMTQQGWSEDNRKEVERQFESVMERSHELNPNGNIPVTIHSSMMPGSELLPAKYAELAEGEEDKKEVLGRMVAVNQETGELTALKREKMFGPQYPEGEIWTPERRLKNANDTQWINSITNLAFYKKEADEVIGRSNPELQPLYDRLEKGEMTEEEIKRYQPQLMQINKANLFLSNIASSFRNSYEQVAKYGDENAKKVLRNISEEWQKFNEENRKLGIRDAGDPRFTIRQSKLLDNSIGQLQMIGETKDMPNGPQIFRAIEDFSKEKASETLSNVAIQSYKKFKNTSPIISIENPPYGSALATGEDLKNLVQETRKKFVDKLVKEGTSRSEAERAAEKLVGATWDTSHISMIRKQGFGSDKVIEETKKIAPFIKHVHLNDNFGHTHTDLPPGMGDLPMKEIVKEIQEKAPGTKKIFEGGNFFQQFKYPPHAQVLGEMGSSVYSLDTGPYWNQVGGFGNYYMGHGLINPPIHHSIYGAGLTTLPVDLGGEMPGQERGRFAQAA